MRCHVFFTLLLLILIVLPPSAQAQAQPSQIKSESQPCTNQCTNTGWVQLDYCPKGSTCFTGTLPPCNNEILGLTYFGSCLFLNTNNQ